MAAARVDGNQELERVATAPIVWDTIVSITDGGCVETYDLTVPETQNFIVHLLLLLNY